MVKERLKFFIRFKKNTDNNISHAIAKQEKLYEIKTSYASINDQNFKNIFDEYEKNSRIYWVKRGEFYTNYHIPELVSETCDPSKNGSSTVSLSDTSEQLRVCSKALKPTLLRGILSRWTSLEGQCLKNITPQSVFRLIVILMLALSCYLQCYTMIISYLAYPSSVSLSERIPTQLLETLPGITICNNNRLSLRRLLARNSRIKDEVEKTFGTDWDSKHFLTQTALDEYRDKISVIYNRLGYNADNDVLGTNMNDQFQIKPDSELFIKWLDCARTWVDTVECDQFKQIHSIQDRRCTTFFYEGVLYYNLINRPDLFNNSRTSTSGRFSYFDTKQVAKFILDFRPRDYGDLKRQIGARIIFHSRKQVATQADVDYFVTRGYHYDFHISRSDTQRLGYPYDTHCRNYFSAIDQYTRDPNASTRIELSRQSCLQNCIVRNAIKKCKCWPPLMPYYQNDEMDVNKNLEVCRWSSSTTLFNSKNMSVTVSGLNGGNTENLTTHQYFDCYKIFHRRCHEECPAECRTTEYSVVSERMRWPSDANILFDEELEGQKDINKILRSCCALITIKFQDFQHTVHQYVPKYVFVDLVGNIGGLLALWLGISIVSVYYTVQKLIAVFKDRNRHKRQIYPQYKARVALS